ncbi:MAG: Dabb family protein [Actinomycetota bacterium]|nr:Dabb family protein [Actinomycetota bacterium]
MSQLDKSRIRHTVAFTLRHEDGSPEAASFFEALAALGAIDGVEELQVLSEVSPKNSYRHGVTMEFASRAAYEAYNASPEHVEFVRDRWDADVADFLEIDFVALG